MNNKLIAVGIIFIISGILAGITYLVAICPLMAVLLLVTAAYYALYRIILSAIEDDVSGGY